MKLQSIKYQFIEEIFKIEDKEILISLQELLKKLNNPETQKNNLDKFSGIWSDTEADDISEIIKDSGK